jgi:hypothetical protein
MAIHNLRNKSILGTDYYVTDADYIAILRIDTVSQVPFDILFLFKYCPRLPAVVGRCSHLEPVHHRCPYHASERPSSTYCPAFSYIN